MSLSNLAFNNSTIPFTFNNFTIEATRQNNDAFTIKSSLLNHFNQGPRSSAYAKKPGDQIHISSDSKSRLFIPSAQRAEALLKPHKFIDIVDIFFFHPNVVQAGKKAHNDRIEPLCVVIFADVDYNTRYAAMVFDGITGDAYGSASFIDLGKRKPFGVSPTVLNNEPKRFQLYCRTQTNIELVKIDPEQQDVVSSLGVLEETGFKRFFEILSDITLIDSIPEMYTKTPLQEGDFLVAGEASSESAGFHTFHFITFLPNQGFIVRDWKPRDVGHGFHPEPVIISSVEPEGSQQRFKHIILFHYVNLKKKPVPILVRVEVPTSQNDQKPAPLEFFTQSEPDQHKGSSMGSSGWDAEAQLIDHVSLSSDENLLLVKLQSQKHPTVLFVIEKTVSGMMNHRPGATTATADFLHHYRAFPLPGAQDHDCISFLPFDLKGQEEDAHTPNYRRSVSTIKRILDYDDSLKNRPMFLNTVAERSRGRFILTRTDVYINDCCQSSNAKTSSPTPASSSLIKSFDETFHHVRKVVVSPCGKFCSFLFTYSRNTGNSFHTGEQLINRRFQMIMQANEIYERAFISVGNGRKVPAVFASTQEIGKASFAREQSQILYRPSADESKIHIRERKISEEPYNNEVVSYGNKLRSTYGLGSIISSSFSNL